MNTPGNTPEWCSDFYDPDYFLDSPATDPENTTVSKNRIVKGASIHWDEDYALPFRSSARIPWPYKEEEDLDEYEIIFTQASLRLIAVKI